MFGEGEEPRAPEVSEETLRALRARVDAITPVMWSLRADERRAEAEWRAALDQNARLDREIAQARAAGDESRAKDLIDEQWRWRDTADGREAHLNELYDLRGAMRVEARQIEELLWSAGQRARATGQSERYAQALKDIEALRRDVTRAVRALDGPDRDKD